MENLIKPSNPLGELVTVLNCLGIVALAGFTIFALAKRAKLLEQSKLRADWPKLLLVSLFVPSILEEIIFRGLWYRADFSDIEILIWLIITSIVFVIWHVIEGMTFLKAHKTTFLNPWFLACTAVLGIVNCAMIFVSNSIWPAIVFHWLVVFIWQAKYGGVEINFTKLSKAS